MASSCRVFGNRCRALLAAASTSTASAAEKPKRLSGIQKVHTVSPALAKFLGSSEASRTDAIKKFWDYVKAHNLQNPSNKKEIFCDEKLKTICGGQEKVNFQSVAKFLSSHFPKAS